MNANKPVALGHRLLYCNIGNRKPRLASGRRGIGRCPARVARPESRDSGDGSGVSVSESRISLGVPTSLVPLYRCLYSVSILYRILVSNQNRNQDTRMYPMLVPIPESLHRLGRSTHVPQGPASAALPSFPTSVSSDLLFGLSFRCLPISPLTSPSPPPRLSSSLLLAVPRGGGFLRSIVYDGIASSSRCPAEEAPYDGIASSSRRPAEEAPYDRLYTMV